MMAGIRLQTLVDVWKEEMGKRKIVHQVTEMKKKRTTEGHACAVAVALSTVTASERLQDVLQSVKKNAALDKVKSVLRGRREEKLNRTVNLPDVLQPMNDNKRI